MAPEQDNICFVIAPIGPPDTPIRRRSDQVFKHVIDPAVQQCGYKAVRADHISEPGIITSQIIQHIIETPMVIADLTGRNPNVFYELAIRHAIRKPYVQMMEKGEEIPFDVAGIRTIMIDHHDLDSVEAAKGEMVRQMQSMQHAGYEVQSPISAAVDLHLLRQSGNPQQRQLADLHSSMASLRTVVSAFEKSIGSQLAEISQRQRDPVNQPIIRSLSEDLDRALEIIAVPMPAEKDLREVRVLLHEMRMLLGIVRRISTLS